MYVREWGGIQGGGGIFLIQILQCIALVRYANTVLRDGGWNDENQCHILQHPHQVISLSEGWRLLCAVLRGCGLTDRTSMAGATGTPS